MIYDGDKNVIVEGGWEVIPNLCIFIMLILFTNCKKSNYTKTSYQNLFSTLIDLVTHFAIVINPELLSNSHPKSNQGERVEEFPIKDKHRIE